jgi:hypothetical protein
MKLRYAGACSVCAAQLAKGDGAEWNRVARVVTCLDCVAARTACCDVAEPVVAEPVVAELANLAERDQSIGIDAGVAGASAALEYERRHQRRQEALKARWRRLAPIADFFSDDPQSTTAWNKGSDGERRLGRHLARVLGDAAFILNDRKLPATKGNIDHVVVASSGIWIVDAKNYGGKVELRDVGGWTKVDRRLFVGGRDRTHLADGLQWQLKAVNKVLAGETVDVHMALGFTDAEWKLFAKPFRIHDVWVTWADALAELIATPGSLEADHVKALAERLSGALPAAMPATSAPHRPRASER